MKKKQKMYIHQPKIKLNKSIWGGRDQDGRIQGHAGHLPPQIQQKYISMWKNSQGKLTGNWQKNSYKTKAIIKIHT